MIQLERWHTSLWLQPFLRIIQLSFQETQNAFELRPKIERHSLALIIRVAFWLNYEQLLCIAEIYAHFTYRQFADSTSFFTQYILCSGCHDNNFCPGGGNSDFNTRVSILGKFTGQELIEFGFEDTVSDKL